MNDSDFQKLLETRWRRELTPEETAWSQVYLDQHEEARALWQSEMDLSQLLDHLPTPALSSNFTAQVLRSVSLDQAGQAVSSSQSRWWRWLSRPWLKVGWAAGLLLLGSAVWFEHRHQNQEDMAKDLAKLQSVPSFPSADVLQDFEVIQQFSKLAPHGNPADTMSDADLLAALQ